MEINKAQLQEALERVRPGLASKEVIEQTTSFAFINGRVVTYNDEISVSHPIEGLQLEGAIQAEHLYKFLSKLKKDTVELTLTGSEIRLTSGRAKAGITLQTEIKLPLEEDVAERGEWIDIPENFIRFLGFAMTSCGKDMSRPALTCLHISQSGNIEASDGYRLTRCTLEEELPFKSFLLPASSAVEIVKLQPMKFAAGNGWMHFQTEEGTILSCRIIGDKYPDLDAHLVVKGEQIVLPKTITEVMDRAMVFAKRDHLLDESLQITIENRRFKVRAEADSGWFEEEINIHYEGTPIHFTIAPYLLKEILHETQGCTIGTNKLKFEGEHWKYVTLLRTE